MSETTTFPEWKNLLGEKNKTTTVIRNVVKRSGEIKRYDPSKITAAINKAIEAVEKKPNEEKAKTLTIEVEKKLKDMMSLRHEHSIPAIEEIQDIVETVLIERGEVAVAKAYILYRSKHEAIRDTKNLVLDINKTMDGYLSQSDWRVNENANVNSGISQ